MLERITKHRSILSVLLFFFIIAVGSFFGIEFVEDLPDDIGWLPSGRYTDATTTTTTGGFFCFFLAAFMARKAWLYMDTYDYREVSTYRCDSNRLEHIKWNIWGVCILISLVSTFIFSTISNFIGIDYIGKLLTICDFAVLALIIKYGIGYWKKTLG